MDLETGRNELGAMGDSLQPQTPSRHEKSLGLLTTKFVTLLQEAKDGVLDLKAVSTRRAHHHYSPSSAICFQYRYRTRHARDGQRLLKMRRFYCLHVNMHSRSYNRTEKLIKKFLW